MGDRLTHEDVMKAVQSIEKENAQGDFTFFAQWEWWERLGRGDRFLGYPVLVLCPQDNKWHTPTEIKEKGW